MKLWIPLLVCVTALIGCTWVNPRVGYVSILQNKALEGEYNANSGDIKIKYNVDNSPAVEAAKVGADLVMQGYQLKTAQTAIGAAGAVASKSE